MQRERIRCIWYCAPQCVGIGGGSANVLWLQIGGAFAVICACHMEQSCNDEALHGVFWAAQMPQRTLSTSGCPKAAAKKAAQNEALAVVTH